MRKAWKLNLIRESSRGICRLASSTDLQHTLNQDVEPIHVVSASKDITEFVMSKYFCNPLVQGIKTFLIMGYVNICRQFSNSIYTFNVLGHTKHFADRQQALVSILTVESKTMLSNNTIYKFLNGIYIGFIKKAKSFPEKNTLFKTLSITSNIIKRAKVLISSESQPGDHAKFHYC